MSTPKEVPYFNPKGVYKVAITLKVEEIGCFGDNACSDDFIDLHETSRECIDESLVMGSLPADGANMATIAMIKAFAMIQEGGLLVHTDVFDDGTRAAMIQLLKL